MSAFTKLLLPKESGLKGYAQISEGLKKELLCEFEELYFRGEDIPKLVEEFNSRGVKAIGLTGNDLFQEYLCKNSSRLEILERIPWNDELFLFKKPSLCLLGYQSPEKFDREITVAINRKYERLSENFLETLRRNGVKVKTQVLNGNTELAVWDGLADYCVEIVCSGKTAKKFELSVLKRFFESDWVLVGIDDCKKSQLGKLALSLRERIDSASESSYTSFIVKNNLLLKKLNEECFELVEAAIKEKRPQIVWETADLIYFASVLLAKNKIQWSEVWNELERRELEKQVQKVIA